MSDFRVEPVTSFHGHMCMGLALGIRAARLGLESVRTDGSGGLVVVSETRTCAVDAVQYLTGCSLGRGTLLVDDQGKNAFTFFPPDAAAVRVAVRKPSASSPQAPATPVTVSCSPGSWQGRPAGPTSSSSPAGSASSPRLSSTRRPTSYSRCERSPTLHRSGRWSHRPSPARAAGSRPWSIAWSCAARNGDAPAA